MLKRLLDLIWTPQFQRRALRAPAQLPWEFLQALFELALSGLWMERRSYSPLMPGLGVALAATRPPAPKRTDP